MMSDSPSIPGYELLKSLGRGYRLVYLARQKKSDRLVYLTLAHRTKDVEWLVDQMQRHAGLLALLDHPNILRLIDTGSTADYYFIALEHAENGSLADRLHSGPLHTTEAASVARAIADALQHARSRKVIQDDLNTRSVVFMVDDTPKIDDFRAAGEDRSGSRETPRITPGYMAPEEAADGAHGDPTPATDVYRIGAIFYAMLTGHPPFRAANNDLKATIRQIQERLPDPIRPQNHAVSAELEAICLRCLEKQPSRRFSDPGVLMIELDNFLEERGHRRLSTR